MVGPLLVQLGRAERLADQATEADGQLLAVLVGLEDHGLARVAHLHLVVPRGLVDMKQHVLKRDILHRHPPSVKVGQALCGLLHEELRMRLLEAVRLLLQRLQEVAAAAEVEDDVVAVEVLEVLLGLHDVLVPPHELREVDLAQRHLAKLDGAGLLSLGELALMQHLDRKVPPRGEPLGLVDAAEEGALQAAHELVLLALAADVGPHDLHLCCRRAWRRAPAGHRR
mmetsp:Transcript_69348/g.184342  ORF Transcript_69348/g.184342 Transcript_69348/m.184342 type:complete len:226 (-) Transcript_69348:27-704(-)